MWRVAIFGLVAGFAACGGASRLDVEGAAGASGASALPSSSGAAGAFESAGSAGRDGRPQKPVWGDTWNVRARVRIDEPSNTGEPDECTEFSFVLGFDRQGDPLSLVVGRDGRGSVIPLRGPDTDGSIWIREPASHSLARLPSEADCYSTSAQLEILHLYRVGDELVGLGSGVLEFDGDDYTDSARATFELSGTLDETAPVLVAPSALDPMDAAVLTISEPLAATELRLQGTSDLELKAAYSGTYIAWLNPITLPFGGSWQVVGEATDLAGHPLVLGHTVTTLPDPGVFAQDGFEGRFVAVQRIGSQVVDARDGYPVPTGQRALLVSDQATLHLRREGGEQSLVFEVVELLGQSAGYLGWSGIARVAVVGGPRATEVGWPSSDPTTTMLAAWPMTSAKTEVRVPLAGEGTDVIVRFETSAFKDNALLIDDLHVE